MEDVIKIQQELKDHNPNSTNWDGVYDTSLEVGTYIAKMDLDHELVWPVDYYAFENTKEGMVRKVIPKGMENPF